MSKGKLKEKLVFPIRMYEKWNGYLGIVGVHRKTGEFYISSKSSRTGIYAEWVKELVYSLDNEVKEKMKQHILENNVTFIFEVIKHEKDPHIIKYDEDKLVLLSIVYNKMDFEEYDYDTVVLIAKEMGVEYAKFKGTLNSWEEFLEFHNEVDNLNPFEIHAEQVEGYIFKDANNFMVKSKTNYYNFWKKIRGGIQSVNSGNKMYLEKVSKTEQDLILMAIENHKAEIENKTFNLLDFIYSDSVEQYIRKNNLAPMQE